MTLSELERLAAVEVRVETIDGRTERIENKLDRALESKADKSEVTALSNKIDEKADAADVKKLQWWIIGALLTFLVTVIGLLAERM
jgi:hypothetical protein